MNFDNILEEYSLTDFPVGLGGCHNNGHSFECCEYNITVFDEKDENDLIIRGDENSMIKIHHGSLNESNSNTLIQLSNMKIICDDHWDLRMFLSKIKEKQNELFTDATKNCLLDSLFCNAKARNGLKSNDVFSPYWLECSAFYLADAICFYNKIRPSPAHMLETLRKLKKNQINQKLSTINQCIGIERATPILLDRMCKSTMGFSDIVQENHDSRIILQKHDFLTKNSLSSDCYFYFGYLNRNNMIKIKDSISRKSDLIHILKVAFDVENDPTKIESRSSLLQKTANDILSLIT
jgi:hypothetical protein